MTSRFDPHAPDRRSREELEARVRFYEAQMKALAAECDRMRVKLVRLEGPDSLTCPYCSPNGSEAS